MRTRLLGGLTRSGALLVLVGMVPAPRLEAQSCRPANDTTKAIIARLTYWITVTDPAKVNLRNTAFKIPVVATNKLVVATDTKICAKAAQAYAARFGRPTSASVFAVVMGSGASTWYAVYDPSADYHELASVVIFDRQWNHYGGYTW